jgi:Cof subfamily protein (haloacid dehalogenase superfamily)
MTIRLLALDLDGTLLHSRGHITERNREALARARDCGVRVAVVTGRRFRDARPIALDLGLDVPVIAHNGALTKHARTLETVAVNPLPLDVARDAMKIGRAAGEDPLISDDHEGLGILIYDHISGENRALMEYIAWAKRIHGDEGVEAIRKVESVEEYLDHSPVHLAFSGSCARMKSLAIELKEQLSTRVKIFVTSYPPKDFALIDLVHPEASKGAGVAAAAAELGITRDEVMAVGDNLNDLEMLHYAGVPVVMQNAEPELRQVGHFHVTASNDADGVAVAVERFILSGQ